MTSNLDTKKLQQASFDERTGTTPDDVPLFDYAFGTLLRVNALIPPWWTSERDRALRFFYRKSDHLSGANIAMISKMTAIPLVIRPKNPHVRAHHKMAQEYQDALDQNSNVGRGWHDYYSRWLQDYLGQDNGAFAYVMSEGSKTTQIIGRPLGMYHLDAGLCTRTSDPEYPVVYKHPQTGEYIKLHRSRAIPHSSMTAPEARMYGIGFCAVSRSFNAAQSLIDVATYKQEKLGSRPLRAILSVTGMTLEQVIDMIREANIRMNQEGLTRFARILLLASTENNLDVKLTDLASLPDGFSEEETTTLAMYTIALAYGVDPREFWPTSGSGATKADATVQHQKARGKAPSSIMRKVEWTINNFFLPPELYCEFDYNDDAYDRNRAQIIKELSEANRFAVDAGILNTRAARWAALQGNYLSEEQFEELELSDGRLFTGEPVESLFFTADPEIKKMLSLQIENPLQISKNDPETVIDEIERQRTVVLAQMVNTVSPSLKQKTRQALAALDNLLEMYEQKIDSDIQEQVDSISAQVGPDAEGGSNDGAEGGAAVELKKKSYEDYLGAVTQHALDLFYGNIGRDEFVEEMGYDVRDYLFQAYATGIKTCGTSDLLPSDLEFLDEKISEQVEFVDGFADAVIAANNANSVQSRASLWANAYRKFTQFGRMNRCGDTRVIWRVNPSKEHCDSCLALDGLIFKLSDLKDADVYPQSSKLQCGGWRCGCDLEDTTKPVSGIDPHQFIY